jgi:hypothetical protein
MASLDELVNTVMKMAEQSQQNKQNALKAQGIDNFGSLGFKTNEASVLAAKDRKELLDRAAEKDKAYAVIQANKVATEKAFQLEQMKTDRQEGINQRYLDVQQLRNDAGGTGGSGTGGGHGVRRDGSANDAELMKLAVEHSKANQGLPGKPETGISVDAAYKTLKTLRDGSPAERAAAAKTIQASQVATPDTPSALNTKDWNAYGKNYTDQQIAAGRTDVQAPMKFEGLQPGMQGDQIGRFTKADGSTHFANTGAVQNAAPAPVITPMASTVNRDASIRNTPVPVSTPTNTPISQTPDKMPGDWAGGITRFLERHPGDSASPLIPVVNGSDAYTNNTPSPIVAVSKPYVPPVNNISISPGAGTKGLGLNFAPNLMPQYPTNKDSISPIADWHMPQELTNTSDFGVSGYADKLDAGKSSPSMPRVAKGFLEWAKDRSRRKLATDKAFINY